MYAFSAEFTHGDWVWFVDVPTLKIKRGAVSLITFHKRYTSYGIDSYATKSGIDFYDVPELCVFGTKDGAETARKGLVKNGG